MGVQYYLARDDSHTLFELGKMGEWRAVFERYRTATAVNASEIVAALVESTAKMYVDSSVNKMYLAMVVGRVIRWAEGAEYKFISEFDRRIDDGDGPYWGGESWSGGTLRITGTRFGDLP